MARDTLYKFYDEFNAIKGGITSTTPTPTPPPDTGVTKKHRLAWIKTLTHNPTLVHQSTEILKKLTKRLVINLDLHHLNHMRRLRRCLPPLQYEYVLKPQKTTYPTAPNVTVKNPNRSPLFLDY
ncbi:hypothetical protein F2P56_010813 [Juglans regia]|uniref:Uncharacterized protein n=2 Tax=Juglans regia TaxID=51240 RepID=A0A833XLG5_JUGRE|nr:uncharacterized protein LOC108986798 [Juglans regia]KAF5470291.1 hypothetical protein F2P56_010813 [Juglans regia]